MKGIVLILLICFATATTSVGQAAFLGLKAGISPKPEVDRVLGRPVRKVSETLIEYRPQPLTGKIFVQYRKGSPVVERIEMVCRTENSTCDDLIRSLNLRLPENVDTAKADDDPKWKRLYGPPFFVVTSGQVTSGDMGDVTSDSFVPAHVAFYSRELYEAEFERTEASNKSYIAKLEEDHRKVPVPEPGQITGIVKLNGNPVAGASIDLYRPDLPGSLQTKTDRHGIFIFFGGLRGSYVAVASGPGMKWIFVKGLNIPIAAALEIVAQPGDGARPTEEQVRASIRSP